MPRPLMALLLVLLTAACSAQQLAATARASCRGSPERCTDPDQTPAARSPGR